MSEASDAPNKNVKTVKEHNVPTKKKRLWLASSGKAYTETKFNLAQNKESREIDRQQIMSCQERIRIQFQLLMYGKIAPSRLVSLFQRGMCLRAIVAQLIP